MHERTHVGGTSLPAAGEMMARLGTPRGCLEVEQPERYGQYLVSAPLEVRCLLRSLAQRGSMAVVYVGSQILFFTSILALGEDDETVVLQRGHDPEALREALQANRLLISTSLDHVKVQFVLNGVRETRSQGWAALAGPLPATVLRLQRREYFRLAPPSSEHIHCRLPVRGDDGALQALDLIPLDISGGGLCLQVERNLESRFQVGAVLPDCHLLLPAESDLTLKLCVRNVFAVSPPDREEYFRAGCEYLDLAGARLNLIQRYISRIERQRGGRYLRP